jgi:hypothetical protein
VCRITMVCKTALLLTALILRQVAAQNQPLAGVSLRCCVLEEAPYAMSDPARPEFGNWSGLAIDVRSSTSRSRVCVSVCVCRCVYRSEEFYFSRNDEDFSLRHAFSPPLFFRFSLKAVPFSVIAHISIWSGCRRAQGFDAAS